MSDNEQPPIELKINIASTVSALDIARKIVDRNAELMRRLA
jgi:hypothetical protein